ncbi:thioredoxin h [Guillardia theta CCMP2712]|uniref:Thioredoxin h n=1 Tax=Guillardia theta (strain CCMP2712) TaxID=905079 RepID=L1JTP3_GUITC|nr:thioredoxin h [Guillardia theta CCMP2712]EKX51767.1 thioredoxin h [Guillardia theta CCMP2712]|eukprot:XP_005838747.1 thioredoxin h [Guillardia theta CCMP2712]
MIICLGPICFPIWHILPVLFLLFAKARSVFCWLFGYPQPGAEEGKDKIEGGDEDKNVDGAVKAEEDGGNDTGLRQRKKNPEVLKVESTEHWERLLKESKDMCEPLVVDFTARWCKPCKQVAPFFEELNKKHRGIFVSVDVDDLDAVAAEAGVTAMPTFQVYKRGKKVKEVTGAFKEDLENLVVSQCT